MKITIKHGIHEIIEWRAFSLSSGVDELIQCDKHSHSKEYISILDKELVSTIDKLFSPVNRADIIFQHENAPSHTPKLTMSGFLKFFCL